MANRDYDYSSGFLSGLVFGLLGGFIAGVLSADKPGRELRRDIEINSAEWAHGLRERIEELKEQAADKISDFKGFADEKFKKSAMTIQDKVADLGKQLEELTTQQKQNTH